MKHKDRVGESKAAYVGEEAMSRAFVASVLISFGVWRMVDLIDLHRMGVFHWSDGIFAKAELIVGLYLAIYKPKDKP